MKQIKTMPAAFESWMNGRLQLSSFYVGQAAIDFAAASLKSGTFATLHVYNDSDKAWDIYSDMIQEIP